MMELSTDYMEPSDIDNVEIMIVDKSFLVLISMYCLTSPVNLPAKTGQYRLVHFNRNLYIFTYALHILGVKK